MSIFTENNMYNNQTLVQNNLVYIIIQISMDEILIIKITLSIYIILDNVIVFIHKASYL